MPLRTQFEGGPMAGALLSWDLPLPPTVWWFHPTGALGWSCVFAEDGIPGSVQQTARYDLVTSDKWTARYTHTPEGA